MTTGKPLFITLEGIEGAGKSVQMALLVEEFRRREVPLVATREPGGTALGMDIRQILLRKEGATPSPMVELLLYLADRCQHLTEVVEPSLAAGIHVLSDRYHDATLVYQGFARGIGFEVIDRLAADLNLRKPDLTLVLDIDVEAGLERARRRNREAQDEEFGRFEEEALDFHRKVREGYARLARREPDRVFLIPAQGDPQSVRDRLIFEIERRGAFGLAEARQME